MQAFVNTLEKKVKEYESFNSNLRKKILSLNKEIDVRDKIIFNNKQEKQDYEDKIEVCNLLILRAFDLIKTLFSKSLLNTLSLQYMNIEDMMMATLGKIIELHPSIENINLEGNNLTDEGVNNILSALCTTTGNINYINLSFNKVTIKGAWNLLRALQTRENLTNRSIKKIVLSYNLIEENDLYLKA